MLNDATDLHHDDAVKEQGR